MSVFILKGVQKLNKHLHEKAHEHEERKSHLLELGTYKISLHKLKLFFDDPSSPYLKISTGPKVLPPTSSLKQEEEEEGSYKI